MTHWLPESASSTSVRHKRREVKPFQVYLSSFLSFFSSVSSFQLRSLGNTVSSPGGVWEKPSHLSFRWWKSFRVEKKFSRIFLKVQAIEDPPSQTRSRNLARVRTQNGRRLTISLVMLTLLQSWSKVWSSWWWRSITRWRLRWISSGKQDSDSSPTRRRRRWSNSLPSTNCT